MNRIWEQTGDVSDRGRRGDQVDGRSYPGDGPISIDGGNVGGDTGISTSPPKYEDLYASPPPVDPIGPVMGGSGGLGIGDDGIRWDDESADSSNALGSNELDWDDDDGSDWEE